MKLRKCKKCGSYTLKNLCQNCKEKTSDAHYKFLNLKKQNLIIK